MSALFAFRADGSASIGSGHVQRCLSIAEALREAGAECLFLSANDHLAGVIADRGFPLRVLGGDPADLSQELPQLLALLAERPATLLVDTYAATSAYLTALLPHTRLWVMDDFGEDILPCHGIIAYNVYTKIDWYDAHYPLQQKLLGPAYAPLRAEFRGLPARRTREETRSVLVTTGGTDPLGMGEKLLEAAMRRPALAPLRYEVVAGAFHPGLPALQGLSKAHPTIEIHTQATHMAALMTACDLAVSACGSTLYELCACGTPGAIFAFADNQLPGLERFARDGTFLGGGDARLDAGACVDRLLDGIERLAGDAALRRDMAEKMRALVDGEGARRIAGALLASRY